MAEEKQSLNDAFYELLSEDMSLLSKPDELCEKLERMVSTGDYRKYKAVEKAFGMNIGEGIFAVISDEERLKEALKSAGETLENSGMQTAKINDVIGLIESAISKIKEEKKAEEERLAEEAANAENSEVDFEEESVPERDENIWYCQNCGKENTGKFCQNCGTSKEGIQPQKFNASKVNFQQENTNSPNENFQNNQSTTQRTIEQNNSEKPVQKEQKDFNKIYLIIGVIIFFIVGAALYKNMGDDSAKNAPAQNTVQSSDTTNKSNSNTSNNKTTQPAKKQKPKPASAPSDLAFGEIYIGQSESDVRKILGKANKVSTPFGPEHYHHEYDDLTVVIANGKVTGFISNSDKYATKRGIYEGATRADVESAYGKSNHAFNADGYDIIMEYPFTSEDKRPCLLRFAIKNGKVDYVSSRIWIDEEDRQKAHSPNAAAEVFVGFHNDINQRNFSSAFGAFSKERQSRYQNSWTKFSEGYGTTISSEVTNLSVISSNDNEILFSYRLLARDREKGGAVRRVFDGKVLMVFENNAWKIAETESKKVSESRE